MKKRIFSVFLATIMVIGSSSMVFAGSNINDMNSFKNGIQNLPDVTSKNYDIQQEQLLKNTNQDVIEQFIDDKLSLAEEKINNYDVNLNIGTTTTDYIDLGDNCYVKVTVEDKKDGASKDGISLRSTPGAETIWKNYGDRQFTVYYDIFVLLIDWQLYLTNHYTLSSTGINIRYGEAWVNDSGVGSGTPGNIITSKATASVGQTASMSCIYKLTALVEGIGLSKNYKLYNNVKCSEIDKVNKQVKVVQSWSGGLV